MAVEILRPNTSGDVCDIPFQNGASCPNHYQNVDEVTPDEGTTAVKCSGTDTFRLDLYNIPDHVEGSDTINHITVHARCYDTSSTSQTGLKIAIKSGTGAGAPDTVSEGSEELLTNSWENYSKQWTTNPATSSPWTWDEIDELQIGLYLRRGSGSYQGQCTQVYVEIDYVSVSAPTVTTQAVDNIAAVTATGHGNITDTGGENPHTRGVCWNIGGNPTTADSRSEDNGGGSYGTGAFSRTISGLFPGNTYYVKAYAINSIGTSYGNQVSFTTLSAGLGNKSANMGAKMLEAGMI